MYKISRHFFFAPCDYSDPIWPRFRPRSASILSIYHPLVCVSANSTAIETRELSLNKNSWIRKCCVDHWLMLPGWCSNRLISNHQTGEIIESSVHIDRWRAREPPSSVDFSIQHFPAQGYTLCSRLLRIASIVMPSFGEIENPNATTEPQYHNYGKTSWIISSIKQVLQNVNVYGSRNAAQSLSHSVCL